MLMVDAQQAVIGVTARRDLAQQPGLEVIMPKSSVVDLSAYAKSNKTLVEKLEHVRQEIKALQTLEANIQITIEKQLGRWPQPDLAGLSWADASYPIFLAWRRNKIRILD